MKPKIEKKCQRCVCIGKWDEQDPFHADLVLTYILEMNYDYWDDDKKSNTPPFVIQKNACKSYYYCFHKFHYNHQLKCLGLTMRCRPAPESNGCKTLRDAKQKAEEISSQAIKWGNEYLPPS